MTQALAPDDVSCSNSESIYVIVYDEPEITPVIIDEEDG